MTAWSLLELSPEPVPPMSGGHAEIEVLHHHQREAEDTIDDLNRRITAAIVAEIESGGLSADLVAGEHVSGRLPLWWRWLGLG